MVRPSEDREINVKTKNLHFVSAWAAGNRLMLGQVKNQEKSNEIEAIPRLSKILDIRHTIVTIDAMGWGSYAQTPQELVLNFDATDDLVHGEQVERFYHGYYENYCSLLYTFFMGLSF